MPQPHCHCLRAPTLLAVVSCQPKCTGERPEERKDGACSSMEEEVVVYIHLQQALICCSGTCYGACSAAYYDSHLFCLLLTSALLLGTCLASCWTPAWY